MKKALLSIFIILFFISNSQSENYFSTICKSNKDGKLKEPVTFDFLEIKKDIWMVKDNMHDNIYHFNLASKKGEKLEKIIWYDDDFFSKEAGFILNYVYFIEKGEIHLWMLELDKDMASQLLKVIEEKTRIEFDYAKSDMMIANKSLEEYGGFFKDCRGSIESVI